jgi:hypothetical protein
MDIVEQMERLAQRGVIDRPMRLPPPAPKPAHPSGVMPGGQLVAPPRPLEKRSVVLGPPVEKRTQSSDRSRPVQAVPAAPVEVAIPRRGSDKEGRRDFMAEREARKAGAASSQALPRLADSSAQLPRIRTSPPMPSAPRPVAREKQSRAQLTDPRIKAAKIMRDGKQLQREDSNAQKQRPRAATSPALQEIPKRRNPPPGGTRSPILRDAGQTNASGRGPGRGSR